MKKKFTIFIVFAVLGILGLLQFPELFVDKQLTYKSFEIYAPEPINSVHLEQVLDSVEHNLKRSYFYQKDQIFKLFFIKGTRYESMVKRFGANNIASSRYDKHLYFGKPNFTTSKLVKGQSENEWLNLVQIISHEAVHSQMYTDYSRMGFMKTPSWINEGYCEYISYHPQSSKANYDLYQLYTNYIKSSSPWIKTEYGSMTPKIYLRDRIIMEYLIDHKQMDILDVIKQEQLNPEGVLKEIASTWEQNTNDKQ